MHLDGGLESWVIDRRIHFRIQRGGKAGGGVQRIAGCREHAFVSGLGAGPARPDLNATGN